MSVIWDLYRQQDNLWDYCLGKKTHNRVPPPLFYLLTEITFTTMKPTE